MLSVKSIKKKVAWIILMIMCVVELFQDFFDRLNTTGIYWLFVALMSLFVSNNRVLYSMHLILFMSWCCLLPIAKYMKQFNAV